MAIRDLATHTTQFVTVAELAEYWGVSRQQIYKRIESGALDAICLGARLYRVRTRTALDYEQRASVNRSSDSAVQKQVPARVAAGSDKLPGRIGPQRIFRRVGHD
jgi:excisionase family DNA binding protein